MDRRPGESATRGVLVLLAIAAPLALAFVLRATPLPALDAAGLGWTTPAFATALVIAAAIATIAALAAGLRDGSRAALLVAGASASLVGGALGLAMGARPPSVSIAVAATFILGAAVTERAGTLVRGRAARVGAAGLLLLAAEAAAAIEILPVWSELLAERAIGLQVAAAMLATVAAILVAGRDLGPAAGLIAVGCGSLALGRGPDAGLLLALAILTAAMLFAARAVIVTDGAAHPTGLTATPPLPSLVDQVSDGVLRFDGRLQLRSWNAAAERMLGLDEASAGTRIEELLGVALPQLPAAEDQTIHHASLGGLGVSVRREAGTITAVIHDAGRSSDAEDLGRELRGTIEELIGARRTIELQRGELERAATTDPLTGVASRAAILDRLGVEVAQARRYQHPVAVVLVDLDHFGELNSAHGIAGGDSALREIALRVRLRVREADALGRSGSDAFLAVLPHTDEGGAARFADALRRRIGQRPVSVGEAQASVTVSVGVAIMRAGEDLDLDGLLARAEDALASARAAGGDTIALDRLHGLARLEDRRSIEGRPPAAADEAGADEGA